MLEQNPKTNLYHGPKKNSNNIEQPDRGTTKLLAENKGVADIPFMGENNQDFNLFVVGG